MSSNRKRPLESSEERPINCLFLSPEELIYTIQLTREGVRTAAPRPRRSEICPFLTKEQQKEVDEISNRWASDFW
jgi:hypothetical protein